MEKVLTSVGVDPFVPGEGVGSMKVPFQNGAIMFPFADPFKGAAYNCQSLFAYDRNDTQDFVLELASKFDFVGLTETRGTEERNQTLSRVFQLNHHYVYSDLDQYKGGIGLVIRQSFLAKFAALGEDNWLVIVKGRVGRLRLCGTRGTLDLFVVYLDPADHTSQVDCIRLLGEHIDSRAHTLIFGDYNFVHNAADRYVKASGAWSMGSDAVSDKAWTTHISAKRIYEWRQDCFTCETGITIARLDRVYSSLHPANGLLHQISCHALDRNVELSAHRPLVFGMASYCSDTSFQKIPSWICNHDSFGEEVFSEFMYNSRGRNLDPFQALSIFKNAVYSSSKYLRFAEKNSEPKTVDEKLSICISFLRALHSCSWDVARQVQRRFQKLAGIPVDLSCANSPEYQNLLDYILELGQTSVKERIDDLKQHRKTLPEHVYSQRKANIASQLKRLASGTSPSISALKDPATGEVHADEKEIARILTEFWQKTFLPKATDKTLRNKWLARIRKRLEVSLEELSPTLADVVYVFDHLPSSSPGPDGIPFGIFKRFKEMLVPLFYDICKGMLEGTATPPDEFNHAFLICLLKSSSPDLVGGVPCYDPSSTRPLSVVDASNRIIASIFLRRLEVHASSWISDAQRGFIKGRSMLRNILEVDFEAQCISAKSKAGGIVLFDFRAAFPSLCHDYLWETLAAIGLPDQYIATLQLFYKNNHHHIKVGSSYYPSITVYSGVRQGCPLSPILFALVADILLRELCVCLGHNGIVRAFADDTAVVVENYNVVFPGIGHLFKEFALISALSLNVSKTVFIPLWPNFNAKALRSHIIELCPHWRDIALQSHGKYLGYFIGPGSVGLSWDKALNKFLLRCQEWSRLGLGVHYSLHAYRIFIVSVLSFVMQLAEDPDVLDDYNKKALRLIMRGPGNWITVSDAVHLSSSFSFPLNFLRLENLSMACKMRVAYTVAKDCVGQMKKLEETLITYGRRPFPSWHRMCFFCTLGRQLLQIESLGISAEYKRPVRGSSTPQRQFDQARAMSLIEKKTGAPYYCEARIRQKLQYWKLQGIPGHLDRGVLHNFQLLAQQCPPRILAVYFKAIWNGWVTDSRLRSLLESQGVQPRSCVLACGKGEDSVLHYACCPTHWSFVSRHFGIPASLRSKDVFLLLRSSLSDNQRCDLAWAMFALHKTVQILRHHRDPAQLSPWALWKRCLV